MTASPDPIPTLLGQDWAAALAGLFASGHAADLVLLCLLAEGAVLAALALRRGASCLPILANVASGAFLVLALRGALLRQDWPAIAVPLLLALFAHGAELACRFRGGRADARERA